MNYRNNTNTIQHYIYIYIYTVYSLLSYTYMIHAFFVQIMPNGRLQINYILKLPIIIRIRISQIEFLRRR